jgi:hypothetical protein
VSDAGRFDSIDDRQVAAAGAARSDMAESLDRFGKIEARLSAVETDIQLNTALTKEIRDVMVAGRVGLKVLGGVGTAIKWLGMLAAAIVAIYSASYLLLHGGPPK